MGTVSHYQEVNVPAEAAYAWWRGLTDLPHVMPDVEEVSSVTPDLTHWKVRGPLGKSVEWDARIIEDVPNTKIAWATEGDGEVSSSGAVRFDDHGETTGVEVSMEYDPPAGAVGEAVAKIFSDPQDKVERAVIAFKETIEAAD
jgi:uncharacterized membrane protein